MKRMVLKCGIFISLLLNGCENEPANYIQEIKKDHKKIEKFYIPPNKNKESEQQLDENWLDLEFQLNKVHEKIKNLNEKMETIKQFQNKSPK